MSIAAYAYADAQLMADDELYCRNLVKIKQKESGALVSFTWNNAQRKLHELLEEQKRKTGRVRALILKYRQGGISTYIAARFYKRTSMAMGKKTYILTHEDPATQNLFNMVKRVHDNIPGDYRPKDTAKNANQLKFGELDSEYAIGTAQNVHGGGRSSTIHLFHGSEVAFWAQASTHFSGVMQAVPDANDTEVILETTGNGPQGEFYDQWRKAEAGESDFIAIFLPWFIQDEYRKPAGTYKPFELSKEEREYRDEWQLDQEQMAWMHFKSIQLGGKPGEISWLFRQEYPASAQEAFQAGGDSPFITPKVINEARKRVLPVETYQHAPIVLGCDIARNKGGGDANRILDRQGRRLGGIYNHKFYSDDIMEVADEIIKAIVATQCRAAFIDITGLGAGAYDAVVRAGYGDRCVAVNFGATARENEKFLNVRAEMWWNMAEWFKSPIGCQMPDDDELHRHIAAPIYGPGKCRFDANSVFQLESKESIYGRLKFSPDGGDAAALTFAQNVYDATADNRPEWAKRLAQQDTHSGSWMSR
jgi:hypothetical protein